MNLQTSLGDVAKRAYDLVVIPEGRADIGGVLGGMGKGDASRGKRYSRGAKGERDCCGVVGLPMSTIQYARNPRCSSRVLVRPSAVIHTLSLLASSPHRFLKSLVCDPGVFLYLLFERRASCS